MKVVVEYSLLQNAIQIGLDSGSLAEAHLLLTLAVKRIEQEGFVNGKNVFARRSATGPGSNPAGSLTDPSPFAGPGPDAGPDAGPGTRSTQ